MKPTLLVVDDDEDIRSQMKWALNADYTVVLAEDRPSAVEAFKKGRPAVVLLDLGLPPCVAETKEGLAALSELLALDGLAKIIVITGQSEKSHALQAIGQGAYDFLAKPVQVEELNVILKRAFHVAQLEREYRDMQARQLQSADAFEGMLGTSPRMQEVFTSIRKVATTDATVLITGESGTGKEMAALAIHRRSHRKDGPFIAINCAAIPETLLESELFGHEKGAFTGAHTQRLGRIESASNGTLFLDEIGDLPLQLQVKLLRFLQEQTIERVGGRKTIQVDARIIAATNSDLKQSIADGKFREDLFFRLAVVGIRIPPLRERPGDTLLLAKAFLQKFAVENTKGSCEFSRPALSALQQHAWPGNVRELENRVKRAVIMAEGRHITAEDLELTGLAAAAESGAAQTLREAREEVERQMVTRALERHGGKIAPAAAELGISRPTFYELMEKLGIAKPERAKE
ncbi:MAG: PEP-CTERM-box response regulator transcription factor [Verrucomicrobia bacterium]|nr:PEP-CTERM-box response regulator transcription factor [Verrucomicrobiota bacterium]